MENGISRRSFLKAAGAGAVGVGAAGVLASYAPKMAFADEAAGTYTAGTYTATATGIGEVTVTVTFDETSITEVVLDVSNETETIGQAAADELIEQVLAAQSADIEGVSGATLTSNAVADGVADCIAQASGTAEAEETEEEEAAEEEAAEEESADEESTDYPEWLGAEPEISDDEITETVDAEVVVCGGGNAGLFAACSAAENGAVTVMLEQFAENAGSGVRDDIAAYNSKVQQEADCPLDPMEMARYLQTRSGWYSNQRLFQVWVDESGETLDWYGERIEEGGYSLVHQLVNPPEDEERSFSTRVGVDWGDDALITLGSTEYNGQYILNPYAESIGVDCRWETSLVKCVKEGDRVTGVIAQDADGNYIKFNASKGVILCCGGYLGNDEMMEALQPEVSTVTVYNYIWPGTNGDGIKAGLWAGATMDPMHSTSTWENALIPPDMTVAEAHDTMYTCWLGPLPYLRVNLDGKRFMNESCEFDSLGHALLYQPGHTAIQIFDSSWQEDAEQFNVYGAHRYFPYDNDVAPLFSIETVVEEMEPQIEEGLIVTADTIEELAEAIGVPSDNLVETVERYNELCDAGEDSDFGKPAYRMSRIDEPPYYALRFAEQGSHTMDGLLINADMQVLDENLEVIPGLYAAGDNAGGSLGVTYLGNAAGNAAGKSVTFARHAGRVAALSEAYEG